MPPGVLDLRDPVHLPPCSKGMPRRTRRAGIRSAASAKGAWILRCSTSRIAVLMPVDNERKHGGSGADLPLYAHDVNSEEEKKRADQLKLCDFDGRNVLVDYYVYRESLNSHFVKTRGRV
jgi:hypothetical protein